MNTHGDVTRSSQKSTNGRFTILLLGVLLCAGPTLAAHAGADAGPSPEATVTLALSADETRWVHEAVPSRGTDVVRLRRLHKALNEASPDGRVAGAPEAFAVRFVSFARELGLPAYFVLVDRPAVTTDRGPRRSAGAELAAAFGLDGRVVVFDANSVRRPPHARIEVLDDRKAAAVIHRNAAVRLLAAGDVDSAVERLESAVELAPDMALAWSALGGALRRAGQPTEALDAYERSIALALTRR